LLPDSNFIDAIMNMAFLLTFLKVIKESLKEALAPITEEVTRSADSAISRLGSIIQERTREGDAVIVVGVGNTIGIA
jgi:hypothetical protein